MTPTDLERVAEIIGTIRALSELGIAGEFRGFVGCRVASSLEDSAPKAFGAATTIKSIN